MSHCDFWITVVGISQLAYGFVLGRWSQRVSDQRRRYLDGLK